MCLLFIHNVIFFEAGEIHEFPKVKSVEEAKMQVLTRWSKKREEIALSMGRPVHRNGRPPFLEADEEKNLDDWVTTELSNKRNPTISQFLEKVKLLYYNVCLCMFIYKKFRFWKLEIRGWRRKKS